MRGFTAVTVLVTVTLAGCGGSDGPSAEERRAALTKWTQAADADCKKANDAIAKRGWPVNLVDLDRLTVRGIEDVQGASKAIRGRKAPAGSEEKIRPFVASLEQLDAKLEELSNATERFKLRKLDKFLPELGGTLQKVEASSKKLGLRNCATHQEDVVIPDAVRAPVFAQQLADLDRRLTKRTKQLNASASTPKAAARNLRELSDIAGLYAKRLDELKPPYWARRQSDDYVVALKALGTLFDRGAEELGEPVITPAEAQDYEADLARASRAERKGIKKLLKSIGAVPTVPGRGGDEAPGEDEAQEA